MKRWLSDILAILIVGVVALWVGSQLGSKHAPQASQGDSQSAAGSGVMVSAVALQNGTIGSSVIGYGQVEPIPGDIVRRSVPLESSVQTVWVTPGQRVSEGEKLVTLTPSPDTLLELEQARQDLEFAQQASESASQRYEMQLSTKAEMELAMNALELARKKLDNLVSRGLDGPTTLLAECDGTIESLSWNPGSIIPPGESVVEIVPVGGVQVMLRVEPADIARITMDQEVDIRRVDADGSTSHAGRVRSITDRIDPATKLLGIGVHIPEHALLLGEYVEGEIRTGDVSGLLVPRQALIARADGLALFTVRDGVAHEHRAEILAQDQQKVIIRPIDGVAENDLVVIVGVAGIEDGTKVEVRP